MIVYQIKLTDFEIRALIGILNEHRLRLKQNMKANDAIINLLLRAIDSYVK